MHDTHTHETHTHTSQVTHAAQCVVSVRRGDVGCCEPAMLDAVLKLDVWGKERVEA